MRKYLWLSLTVLSLSCAPSQQNGKSNLVVCTTGMLADACEQLLKGQDSIRVEALMGPGVDPHLYKATQGDIKKLMSGDIIIYNGLHLEGKMNDLFEKMRQKHTVAAAEAIPTAKLINSSDYADAYDPHVWFDLQLWQIVVAHLAAELIEEYPNLRETINNNWQSYRQKLIEADRELENMILQIPEKQRVLITAHDAFKYYGLRYGIEVKGLQGISTSSEYGIRDVSDLANFVYDRKIKAIFVESSIPKRAIEAVQSAVREMGGEVQLGGELYSDALGSANSPAGSYLGMVKENTETIVKALK